MFGVRALTVDVRFNADDMAGLASGVLEDRREEEVDGRIEGTGVVDCGGGELEFGFYRVRASEW